jgi:RNA polymerase sigma-70 factor (ECF subfamily)
MRDPKETTLLTRLQAGDEQALGDLADAYSAKIYQLAFRYLRNNEDAEEVTQDVLYKVHRKVGTFRGDAALSSWIYRITFNAAMSRLRSAKYQRAQDGDRRPLPADSDAMMPSLPTDIADWTNMADEGLLRSQLRQRVFRAMSTEEASAMLRVKDQTLKSRLHRGRLILRKQLADFAGGLSLHRPLYGT